MKAFKLRKYKFDLDEFQSHIDEVMTTKNSGFEPHQINQMLHGHMVLMTDFGQTLVMH